MKYGNDHDPYLNEQGILKNKLGAKTEAELDSAETVFALRKFMLLMQAPFKGKFDFQHLKDIHRYLFEDIYEWAGEIRTISISKGSSMFAVPLRIEAEANKLFAQLKAENYLQGLTEALLVKRLAFYLGEINILHPFREGNGRTQRAFLILLARNAGFDLHFGQISQSEMVEASIQSHHCNYQPLEDLISPRLTKRNTL